MEPALESVDREAVEGSSTGVLFMTLFGTVWAAAGAGALGGAAQVILLVVALALAATLCLGSLRLRRSARSLSLEDSPQARARRTRVSRSFNLVFGLEGVAIALAFVLLGRYGLGTFIPAVVALIVGVHFFPLAELYRVKVYHLTGAVLCVLAMVAFFLETSARLPLVGLGSAATLFATAAYILSFGVKARRSGSQVS